MNEKLIRLSKDTYIITDGNIKILEGPISEEKLSKIYQTKEEIEYIKEIILEKEQELDDINNQQKIDKKSLFVMRLTPSFGYLLTLILTLPKTLFSAICVLMPFVILQIAEEWFLKKVLSGKLNIDKEKEKKIIANIDSLKYKQKLLEGELKQNEEKITYTETKYNNETIIKPIHHTQEETNITIKSLTKRLTNR